MIVHIYIASNWPNHANGNKLCDCEDRWSRNIDEHLKFSLNVESSHLFWKSSDCAFRKWECMILSLPNVQNILIPANTIRNTRVREVRIVMRSSSVKFSKVSDWWIWLLCRWTNDYIRRLTQYLCWDWMKHALILLRQNFVRVNHIFC